MYLYELPAERPSKQLVSAWLVGGVVSLLATSTGVLFLIFSFSSIHWLMRLIAGIGLVVLAFQVIELTLKKRRWRSWGYDVGCDAVEIMEGVFFVKRSLIPLVAIEHIDTTQNPIERMFGLYSVVLSTAAGEHIIPGLVRDQAESLRTHVRLTAKINND